MASPFPQRPKLSAIVQTASLKRKGLVADCIFPLVKTACKFSYIDWSDDINEARVINDLLGCKTDVHEVDSAPFTLVDKSLQFHGLTQALGECCVVTCGDDGAFASKIEAGKTRQLMNKLLIAREKRAIALATTLSNYTNNVALVPGAGGAVNEGGRYNLAAADFANPNFALLKWFQPIQQSNVLSGNRNKAVMSQATLNGFLSHPNFIGVGCLPNPQTTKDAVAALLGVQEICVADAQYNDGLGATPSIVNAWPTGYILFVTSYDLVTSEDEQFSFGITAYDKGMFQFNYVKEEKGPGTGVVMQKLTHDLTEVVLSYKAATLVVVA